MAKVLELTCVEDPDLILRTEESVSDQDVTGLMFSIEPDSDEGVLLPRDRVEDLREFLDDWLVKQAKH